METAQTSPRIQTVEATPCDCGTQPFMTVPAAAAMFGRSTEYLYAGLREGRFPGAKFGRSWAIPRGFVRGFVADVVELGLAMSFEDYAAQWLTRASEEAA